METTQHLRIAGCLLAASLAWAPAARAAAGARQPAASAPLSGVAVVAEGGFVRVAVRGTAPLPSASVQATTDGPPRLFLDLPGVDPGRVQGTIPGAGDVRRVRVALNSFDPVVTRVVIDLARPSGYTVVPPTAAVPELTIVINATSTAIASAPALAATAATPAPRRVAPSQSGTSGPALRGGVPAVPAPGANAPAAVPIPAAVASPAVPAGATLVPATATRAAQIASPGATAPSPVASDSPGEPGTTQPSAPIRPGGFGAPRQIRPNGRVSVYVGGARTTQVGAETRGYGDVTSAVNYELLDRNTDGVEYGLDVRHTAYTLEGRDPRVSIYTGFVGARLADGVLRMRAGHLWLDDLGGLGALAGGQLEARSADIPTSGFGRWRGGLFGGLEPNVYTAGYSDGVLKSGGYLALEGARGRRHVAGYVNVRNGSLTERSVLSVTNYVPAGPLYVYQSAEYDLANTAGGLGHNGLTYFFSNARLNAGRRLEFMGTVSRGRSVDTRGLSDDIQAGRPVSQSAIDGLQYESLGGRISAEVLPRTRLYAGYSRDKNNRDDAPTGRWLIGGYASNVFKSGLDVTFSDSRTERPGGSYHSMYASVGRELGQRIYATAEYSTALSLVRFVASDGLLIESRPETRRAGLSASVLLWRSTSFVVNAERTIGDDYTELRVLTGLTYRLR